MDIVSILYFYLQITHLIGETYYLCLQIEFVNDTLGKYAMLQ